MEDDDGLARLVAHQLRLAGFRVHGRIEPHSLISDAERDRSALFILDLILREVDGLELCRRIRAHQSLRGIPILILTARTTSEDLKRTLDGGADIYSAKPFTSLA